MKFSGIDLHSNNSVVVINLLAGVRPNAMRSIVCVPLAFNVGPRRVARLRNGGRRNSGVISL